MRRRLLVLAFCFSVVLPATASITGYVMTHAGQPIAGAHIDLFAIESAEAARVRLLSDKPEAAPLASAQSDAKGKFTLDSPKDAVVQLRITAPGYAPVVQRIENDEEGGGIALVAADTKTGHVTAGGKPVANAKVVFNGGELIATTDAQGRYSAPDPSKWSGSMTIIHPDFAIDQLNAFALGGRGRGRRGAAAAPALGEPVDESVDAGIALSGTVVGEDGKTPVPGATILIGGWPLATSANDGTFTVRHAPAKWATVTAKSGDLIGVRSHVASASGVVVKLTKAASFSGSIRDSKSKQAIAGAEVRVWQPMQLMGNGGMGDSWTGLTDAKGNFAIGGIAPGSYDVVITRPGYDFPRLNVSVKAGEKASKALVATPLARVSGTVVDENKRAIAAVRIDAANVGGAPFPGMMMLTGGRMQGNAVTAPDGTFSVRAEPSTDVQLVATRAGYPSAKTGTLHLTPGERKSGIVLTVPNGISVSGKVLDKEGKPLSGVAVAAVESTSYPANAMRRVAVQLFGGRNNEDTVTTGADGSFTVRVKEGTYDLAFKRSGYATKLLRATRVTASTQPFEVTLQPAVEISGRVTRNGTGVEGVSVMVIGDGVQESAQTGPDGSFVISDLSPGQMMINAMKMDEFIQVMRPVTAPADNVVLEVPAGSRISGRVVDKETKQPVTAFEIGVGMSRGGGGMMFSFVPAMRHITSDDGSFVLENVPAGQTQVVVSAPGYTTARVPNVNIEEGKGVSDLEVDMDHGVRVYGHVIGPDGSALAGAAVRVAPSGGGRMAGPIGPGMQNNGTVTDANGDYSIDAVESGDKTIVFAYTGLQQTQKTATLSGTESRVDAQLTSGSSVYGTVVTDTGVPVADAAVNASSATQGGFGYRSTQTDANGNFSFDGLAPGHYTFRASKQGYSTGTVPDFDISTNAPVRLTLKSGGVIFGHVSGLTPDELQSATVQASSATGGQSVAVDSTGNYRMEGAPTGTVRVSARTTMNIAGGKTSPVQSVQVDASSPAQVDIVFKSDTVITGRVTRNGSPVEGAMIAFMPREAQAQTSARTTTTNGGQYSVSGLDDANYNVSVVDIQRSAPYTTTYQVHGSGNFDVDMRAAALRGHVLDTGGNPVSGAIVEVHEKADQSGMPLLNRTVQADTSGAFSVENVQPGNYTLTASKDGFGTKSVDTSVGDADAQVDIALAQNDGVALRVVDARNGQMLIARVHVTNAAGAAVYDTPFAGFGGGTGADVIKLPLEPGTYKAQIMAMNYAPQTVTITSPSSPTIGMTPGGTIAVQSKGSGLRRARLIAADGTPYVGHSFFTVDPAPGVTMLNNIASGMYTLQILGDNNEVIASAPVTVADAQTTTVQL